MTIQREYGIIRSVGNPFADMALRANDLAGRLRDRPTATDRHRPQPRSRRFFSSNRDKQATKREKDRLRAKRIRTAKRKEVLKNLKPQIRELSNSAKLAEILAAKMSSSE